MDEQRIGLEGLPKPSPHSEAERFLFRACQLLDQLGRDIAELLAHTRRGEDSDPVGDVPAGPEDSLASEPATPEAPPGVELVSEPAPATAKKAAKKAAPRKAVPPKKAGS